ncbi:hypothetical protein FOA52_005782 [Chlamydomonas sp. UWO 241]|nr:hypothetical protein FOA52_005782 [Chlamydomonas sp. UWO 241]
MGPRQASNAAWAASKLALAPPQQQVQALLDAVLASPTGPPNAQDLATAVYACARLRHAPGAEWLGAFEAASLPHLQQGHNAHTAGPGSSCGGSSSSRRRRSSGGSNGSNRDSSSSSSASGSSMGFRLQELSNTLYGIARLGHSPSAHWLTAAAAASAPQLSAMDDEALAAALWAGARLLGASGGSDGGVRGGAGEGGDEWAREWTSAALSASAQRLPSLQPRHLASVLWAIARLPGRPPVSWMDRFLGCAASHAAAGRAFSPRGLANVLYALVGLGYRPTDGWLDAQMGCCLLGAPSQSHQSSPYQSHAAGSAQLLLDDAASLLRSCGRLRYSLTPGASSALLRAAFGRLDLAHPHQLVDVAAGLARARLLPPAQWMQRFWGACHHECVRRLSTKELARLLGAVGVMAQQAAAVGGAQAQARARAAAQAQQGAVAEARAGGAAAQSQQQAWHASSPAPGDGQAPAFIPQAWADEALALLERRLGRHQQQQQQAMAEAQSQAQAQAQAGSQQVQQGQQQGRVGGRRSAAPAPPPPPPPALPPQQLLQLAWALGHTPALRPRSAHALRCLLLASATDALPHASSQQLVQLPLLLAAAGASRAHDRSHFLRSLQRAYGAARLASLTGPQLCRLLSGFAALGCTPCVAWVRGALDALEAPGVLAGAAHEPQALSSLMLALHSFGAQALLPPRGALRARLLAAALSSVSAASPSLPAPAPPSATPRSGAAVPSPSSSHTPRQQQQQHPATLLRLLSGLAQVDARPHRAGHRWWRALYGATAGRLGGMAPRQLVSLLYLLATFVTAEEAAAAAASSSSGGGGGGCAFCLPPALPTVDALATVDGDDDSNGRPPASSDGRSSGPPLSRADGLGESAAGAGTGSASLPPPLDPDAWVGEAPAGRGFVLPPTEWVEEALGAVAAGFDSLSGRDAARTLVALVRLRHDASTQWVPRLGLLLETRSAGFSNADHAVVARAWLALGARGSGGGAGADGSGGVGAKGRRGKRRGGGSTTVAPAAGAAGDGQ